MLSKISQRNTYTVQYYLYVESREHKKLMNITQKKQMHRYKVVVTSGRGKALLGVGKWEVQTIECKIGYMVVLYNIGNIANIL